MPVNAYRFAAACLFCLLFALSAQAGPKNEMLQGRLLQAIGSGDTADVRTLLDRGAGGDEPFDPSGLTPIMLAETVEMAVLLCEYGAQVTVRDVDGGTVVHYAVTRDKAAELVPFFVARGADINARGWNGETALHVAVVHLCERRQKETKDDRVREILTMLAGQGADLDSTDAYGYTPLMVAAMAGYEELVGVLLELGADRTLRNADGRTAADLARETGERALLELLR